MKPLTTNLKLLEQQAKAKITPEAYAYVAGSASTESTARGNTDAFGKWHIGKSLISPSIHTLIAAGTSTDPIPNLRFVLCNSAVDAARCLARRVRRQHAPLWP